MRRNFSKRFATSIFFAALFLSLVDNTCGQLFAVTEAEAAPLPEFTAAPVEVEAACSCELKTDTEDMVTLVSTQPPQPRHDLLIDDESDAVADTTHPILESVWFTEAPPPDWEFVLASHESWPVNLARSHL